MKSDKYHEYKEKCKKLYSDPNVAYRKKYSGDTKTALILVDEGDKGLDVWMYPHQTEHRDKRGVSLEPHELKEMALAILEYLGHDVYLKEL